MALQLENKKAIVAEVSKIAANSLSVVAAEYRGLAVHEMDELRSKARKTNVHLQVIRNTLAKRAMHGTEFECLAEKLTGPLLLAFSQDTPGGAARLICDFSKEHDKLIPQAVALNGELWLGKDIKAVASLPTKDEAIAQLMSVMIAPVTKLARTTQEVVGKLVRTTAAVAEAKK